VLRFRFDAGRFRLGLGLASCQGTTEGLLVALPSESELLAQTGNLGAVGRLLNARLVETLHRLGERLPVLAGEWGRLGSGSFTSR
jgi:hypothetical protein